MQRFYFCGGLDCPDWVLVQIAYASKMTVLKFRTLLKETLSSIHSGCVNDEIIQQLASAGQHYQQNDLELCFSALQFIVKSACSHDVGVEIINDELQQLGLPKEHAQALCKLYAGEFDKIRQSLAKQYLRLNSISSAHCSSSTEGIVKMDLGVRSALDDSITDYSVLASKERLSLLLDDLNKIAAQME